MTKVRWGSLGCARVFERRMVPGFRAAENAELVAVASRSREKAADTAARLAIPRAHGSYEELLADPEIEAVYIPLPNDLHVPWTIRALEAGKHVLCDKPSALAYADALTARYHAGKAERRLMEGFMWRHHPQHARVAEILAGGEIGELVHFRGSFTYPAVPDPANIRWQLEHGGGALLDVGVYPMNAARLFFGSEPVAVTASAVTDPTTGVDVHAVALLEFAGGRTAYALGGFDQPFASRYEVIGTRGSVTAERAFQVGESGVTIAVRVGDETRTESFPHTDQYGREIDHFSSCIRNPKQPLLPAEDGVAQARLVEATRRSLIQRRRVGLGEIR